MVFVCGNSVKKQESRENVRWRSTCVGKEIAHPCLNYVELVWNYYYDGEILCHIVSYLKRITSPHSVRNRTLIYVENSFRFSIINT